MSEYTQGVCQDGAAILKDGKAMAPEEICKELRHGERHAEGFNYMAGALEQLEEIVGINTGGMNGPAPVLNAVEQVIKERDALAAHCAHLLSAGWQLKHELQQWSLTESDPETSAVIAAWDTATDEKPSASLARLKAEWQAEALDKCAKGVAACKPEATPRGISITIKMEANELRRQAEESNQ